VRAVSEVSLTISSGLVFSIIGPNGAGKTTLFNLISGIYAPQDGLVRLGSEDVTGLASHLLARRGLSRTFQNLQTIASSASRCRSIRVTGLLQSSSSISRAQYHCIVSSRSSCPRPSPRSCPLRSTASPAERSSLLCGIDDYQVAVTTAKSAAASHPPLSHLAGNDATDFEAS
jgi:energy-coupling factor transporter ATP-binding protein EcfA2